ncbi:phosphoribosyl-AMP cyclohydrolase [Rubritalea marina]|uniref:phosphoribosyl-AMP cyclohydrolase n=1 Tax=Rubritalea marina TaxID=361055 RepID=UPI000377BDE3|nr:phosphoribosyl-AMP cyclohydrolase [Rubritalea marina]
MSDIIKFGLRGDKKALEEGFELAPKFDENGLMPCVAIDHITKKPLMLAYMNEQSLKMTIEIGEVVYYSRSRQEIWHKGATSGHTQKVIEMYTDCDQDAIIVYVDQQGAGACHTGRNSCFYRKIDMEADKKPVTLKITEAHTYDADAVYKKK